MVKHATDDIEDGTARRDRATDGDTVPIAAEIVVAGNRPAECTLYPAEAAGIELMSKWITAHEGSFVDLEAMR